MLEDYIKHFAGSLGVSPGDQAAITPEENSSCYAITLNDSLVCAIETADPKTAGTENHGTVFRFSVAFCGLSDPEPFPGESYYQDQLDSYDALSRRLLDTPALARLSLVIVPENAVIGLREDLPEDGLTPELFISRLNEFIDTALYLSGDPAPRKDDADPAAPENPDSNAARARVSFLALLAAMDISEDHLEETGGRIQVSPSFGTELRFCEASGCLLIENSITGNLSGAAIAFLLSENVRHGQFFRFDYRSGNLFAEQILDLTSESGDPAELIPAFETALGRQEEIIKEVYDSLRDFAPEYEQAPMMNFTPGTMNFLTV